MFEFTEEYEPLLREVREIAEKVVKPRAREIVGDKSGAAIRRGRASHQGIFGTIWDGKGLV